MHTIRTTHWQCLECLSLKLAVAVRRHPSRPEQSTRRQPTPHQTDLTWANAIRRCPRRPWHCHLTGPPFNASQLGTLARQRRRYAPQASTDICPPRPKRNGSHQEYVLSPHAQNLRQRQAGLAPGYRTRAPSDARRDWPCQKGSSRTPSCSGPISLSFKFQWGVATHGVALRLFKLWTYRIGLTI